MTKAEILNEAKIRFKKIEEESISWRSNCEACNDYINGIDFFDNMCLYGLTDYAILNKKEQKIWDQVVILYKNSKYLNPDESKRHNH